MDNLQYRIFTIAKYMVGNKILNQQTYVKRHFTDLNDSLLKIKEIEDAKLLLKMAEKLINEHNSKLIAAKTKLDNLKFNQSTPNHKIKVFLRHKIDFAKIKHLLQLYEEMEDHDIYYNFLKNN